jgi:hypothetical protein
MLHTFSETVFYVAITENTMNDSLKVTKNHNVEEAETRILDENVHNRSSRTLDAIRMRAWKEKWPLVTEVELKSTGPWILKPFAFYFLALDYRNRNAS